jgi:hypothetical protein
MPCEDPVTVNSNIDQLYQLHRGPEWRDSLTQEAPLSASR